jgi:hypothetical protein
MRKRETYMRGITQPPDWKHERQEQQDNKQNRVKKVVRDSIMNKITIN